MQLLEPARKANRGALVAKMALDLAGDRQRCEGRELVAQVRVESLDRFDETEVPDLHDVVQRLAAVLELACQKVDEIVVRTDELLADAITLGWILAFAISPVKSAQLFPGQPARGTH